MAINLKFDIMGNPEPPSIVLANRSGNKLGQLNVDVESIEVKDKFNDISELSFTLNKYVDNKLTPLWDKVVDFKLIYCPEWDLWFETKVELDEATETVKTVFCTQLGQAELSQINIYNTEINTDVDIEREDYKTSILYDKNNPEFSILHRLLEKAPHYSIAYVDESIQRIQRQFSFDGISVCDAFNEIAEEIGCLFVYNSNSTKDGKPSRTISVYDLQQNCLNPHCKHRGEFTNVCPKCNGKDNEGNKYGIKYGYGEDTTIFVTSDELATEGIQLVTDTDSVKNCFKLEAGDDLMTATIRNCNPNGTDYIWYFSNTLKEDMSKELVERIGGYDSLYKEYYNNHTSELNEASINQYNALVEKYKKYYDTPSTCLDCKTEGDFEEQCTNCNSKNILTGQKLESIPTTIVGYPSLMTAYYNTIDLLLYLESGLMPNVEMSDTKAEEQIKLLTTSSLSPVAANVKDIANASEPTAKSAALSMAKVLIRPTYKVDVVDGSSSLNTTIHSDANGQYRIWTGRFIVTNYSNEEDSATSDVISVRVNNDTETFIKQKIEKALNKENTDDYSITGLFAKEYNDFCAELKKYALNPLDNFSKACDTCLSILTEQGAGNEDEKPDLYAKLYKPYFDKQQAVNNEIAIRQSEIAMIEGEWDTSDENNPQCVIKGLQQYIEDCQKEIQNTLDFESYLGEDLWLEFCAYRREDKFSNSNYISDGLNNAELFKKANEFIEVAEEEIFKSAELQHSISATLNNLLSLPKFKPLLKSFKTGNWIRVQVDDKVYKLRLLEYDFGYDDSKSISVEFSDVTKIKNGMTDVQDVFEQASSMASSYDSVQRQAKKGNVARGTIDQWLTDGLKSADVQITSNDSEEIVLTQNGLLARSYDDITGTYSPEQFKLTHNIMAYTDDNWETVSSALGKHNYKYWKDGNFVDAEDYGLSTKFVTAGYVNGSQIIGGEIVSSNYKSEESGTYINLLNGDFDFAGGKIVFDTDKDALTLRNVTIEWSNTNAPEVTVNDVTGLEDYLDELDQLENQLDGRIQTYNQTTDPSLSWTEEEKTNHIGDLWLNPDNGLTKSWNGTSWEVVTDSDLKNLAQSKAQIFTTTPTPPYYVGDLWVQGSSGDILHCIKDRESGSYVASEWSKSSKYTDDTRANSAYSLADSAKSVADNAKTIGDRLVNGLGFQETEITGNYIISPVIAGGHLLIGDTSGTYAQITTEGLLKCANAEINGTISSSEIIGGHLLIGDTTKVGTYAEITEDGTLTCTNARISGAITATSLTLGNDVSISTNNITGLSKVATSGSYNDLNNQPKIPTSVTELTGGANILYSDDVSISSSTTANGITTQKITVGDNEYTSIVSGDFVLTNVGLGTDTDDASQNYIYISKDGLLTAKNALIYGTVYATNGSFSGEVTAMSGSIGGWEINTNSLYYGSSFSNADMFLSTGTTESLTIAGHTTTGWMLKAGSNFGVTTNGNLYATNAVLSGKIITDDIDATGGSIGSWKVDTNSLYYGSSFSNAECFLCTGSIGEFDIGGSGSISGWVIKAGDNFGVTSSGTMYCSDINIFGGNVKIPCKYKNNTSPYAYAYIGRHYGLSYATTGYEKMEANSSLVGFVVNTNDAYSTMNGIYFSGRTSNNAEAGHVPIEFIAYDSTSGSSTAQLSSWLCGTWLSEGTISVNSDRNKKHDITDFSDKYSDLFDALSPKLFKYNNGNSDRYHMGLIAQEVEEAILGAGLTTQECAALCYNIDNEGNKFDYSIRYGELISLLIREVQLLKKKISN